MGKGILFIVLSAIIFSTVWSSTPQVSFFQYFHRHKILYFEIFFRPGQNAMNHTQHT